MREAGNENEGSRVAGVGQKGTVETVANQSQQTPCRGSCSPASADVCSIE